jgi:hypothetical protein
VWVRFFGQPWWLRWLINSALIGLTLGVLWYLQTSHAFERTTLTVLVLVLTVGSLSTGAVSTLVQHPARRTYAVALTGLDKPQRAAAARALRDGEPPTEDAVLTGAIRAGTVSEHYYLRASRNRRMQAVAPILFALLGIGSFFLHDPRHGVLWLLMGALVAAPAVGNWHAAIRLTANVAQLRGVAENRPDIAAADLAPPQLRQRNAWLIVLTVVVVVGAAGAGVAALSSQPRRDCRTADAVVSFLADRSDMSDPALIISGGPSLGDYRDWADHLALSANAATAPDVAPHIQRIADHARDAIALVDQARTVPPPRPVTDLQTAYANNTRAIIDEEHPLITACHPH